MKKYIKAFLLALCKIFRKIIRKVEAKCGQGEKPQSIFSLNMDAGTSQKRVLISYMDYVFAGKELSGASRHSNRYEFCQIIRYFIKHNYKIDICAANDTDIIKYAKTLHYDVIFGFGEVFRKVAPVSSAFKIIYMTENPYHISYMREQERIGYFYERHHRTVPLSRTGVYYKKNDEKLADAVICLGDKQYFSELPENISVRRIWPTAMINPENFSFCQRSPRNFIVLGTDGFVHKGIDLLVEVFGKHREWNLYLCGSDIPHTLKKLGYLPLPSNIKDCGYVDIMDRQFIKLAETCTYILLPSCSEGLSTAILTGMCHGLLPVIMKGNGMDSFEEYCSYFNSFLLSDIELAIKAAASRSQEECIAQAGKIMEYARSNFTIDHFTNSLDKVLYEYLEKDAI